MQASLDLREKSNAPEQPVQVADSASSCTNEGYEILTAYDGQQAMEILKKEEVQLLIVDVSKSWRISMRRLSKRDCKTK